VNEAIKQQILNIGIRNLERATGDSHHTINGILKREHVRRKTLAKMVKRIRYGRLGTGPSVILAAGAGLLNEFLLGSQSFIRIY
jgi:hypothetical protein